MDEDSKKLHVFQKLKHGTLNKKDLSLKGSIDEPIRPLVEFINKNSYYYTTSTCSGRITLTDKPHGKPGIKKGSNFHLVSHDQLEFKNFTNLIDNFVRDREASEEDDRCLWLKFEPFIMHIQCYNLDKARVLLNLALATGCRNSGITLGKPDKFMVAVRSSSSLEVPIYGGSRFRLNENYIRFLHEEANRRLSANMTRLMKFQETIARDLESV